MRYIIDVLKQMPESASFNAWQKAPADVIRTLQSSGAKSKFIIVPESKSKLKNVFVGILNTLKATIALHKGDELYIQRYGYYIDLLASLAKKKGVKLNYIVHDLTFLRFGNTKGASKELSLLKNMDAIFVHTEAMAALLKEKGVRAELKIMHLFDYYSDDAMMPENEVLRMKNVVAFAGNLDKSTFLRSLVASKIPNTMTYHLYGLMKESKPIDNDQITYMGAFKPDKTGKVKAGWGLLWDGDSIETCSGVLGEYLKINSSHKLSLYLTCGMPVILWKKSSLATWLTEKGTCILIDSLDEIPRRLSNITDDEYKKFVENARRLGCKLRNGELLKSLLG